MGQVVGTSVCDGIALVRVDKPPVNAMDQSVRAGLKQAFGELRGKPEVKAIVLACTGRTFIAGADIKEFDTGIADPGFHEVLRLIEDSPVPVIAAVHGTALGAGTEVSLACHGLPPKEPRSDYPSCRSGSFLVRAARNACRALFRSTRRRR